ncbi:hypothetical protein CHUAL_004708 [Chamberlinius hualienensis]
MAGWERRKCSKVCARQTSTNSKLFHKFPQEIRSKQVPNKTAMLIGWLTLNPITVYARWLLNAGGSM